MINVDLSRQKYYPLLKDLKTQAVGAYPLPQEKGNTIEELCAAGRLAGRVGPAHCGEKEGKRKMKFTIKQITFLLTALFTAVLLSGCGGQKKGEVSEDKDREVRQESENPMGSLASFEAGTLEGELFTQEDLGEKDVTVINFWSLTCGPCLAEMPDIAEFAQNLPDNVQMITVCLDGSLDPEETKRVLEEAGFGGVTLISGNGDLAKVCAAVQFTPTTILADAEGNILGEAIIGMQKSLEEVYTEAVNAALEDMGKEKIGSDER